MGSLPALRPLAPPSVALPPVGVAVRTSLKRLTAGDEHVLRQMGGFLGSLASEDLKTRCAVGLGHDAAGWAVRKRELTSQSSSRWAGSITKGTHDQWALATKAVFAHRGQEWADRIRLNRAVAYRVHHDPARERWYATASWQRVPRPAVSLGAALAAGGVIGVDTNDNHYAAWRLDVHGNPVGEPHRFFYDLSGNAAHRDAQIRHATSRLIHWARRCGVRTIAVEDLDFTDSKTRERHGHKKRFAG